MTIPRKEQDNMDTIELERDFLGSRNWERLCHKVTFEPDLEKKKGWTLRQSLGKGDLSKKTK